MRAPPRSPPCIKPRELAAAEEAPQARAGGASRAVTRAERAVTRRPKPQAPPRAGASNPGGPALCSRRLCSCEMQNKGVKLRLLKQPQLSPLHIPRCLVALGRPRALQGLRGCLGRTQPGLPGVRLCSSQAARVRGRPCCSASDGSPGCSRAHCASAPGSVAASAAARWHRHRDVSCGKLL